LEVELRYVAKICRGQNEIFSHYIIQTNTQENTQSTCRFIERKPDLNLMHMFVY
jgi:hypothetical protein